MGLVWMTGGTQLENCLQEVNMSIELGTAEVSEAVSDDTLVNIPEMEDKATGTLIDAEAGGSLTAKKFTVEYKIFPTVPICGITSIILLALGIFVLTVSASHIDGGHLPLTILSALLIAFGIIFACPCFVPILNCLCLCFGIALF